MVSTAYLKVHDAARRGPNSTHAQSSRTKHLGGFLNRQATEIPQLDDLALVRIKRGEADERIVKRDQIRVFCRFSFLYIR